MPGDQVAVERRWGTVGCTHTVLVVVRTLTSAVRLLEVVDLLRGDLRIRFIFTVFNTSRFSSGVHRLLRDAGVAEIVPWSQVRELSYDLALSASENIDTDVVTGPVLLLPHGIGFNKYVPVADDHTGFRVAGLPTRDVLRRGTVRIVLSHPEQQRQIATLLPEAIGHTVVTGDPIYDQLLASEPFRDRYRAQLGTGQRRLVLVSSTWRSDSVLGRWRTLPRQLLAEFSIDEAQFVLSLHPNIWSWYGTRQIYTWLADEIDAGLVLLPAGGAWQAAMVGADQVIVDHGSLGLIAAGLGKPLLLVGAPDEIVPGTPVEQLWNTTKRLDPARGLREQLDAALTDPVTGRHREIADRVFAHVGQATRRLRHVIYDSLHLDPPQVEPDEFRVPDHPAANSATTALWVYSRFDADTALRFDRFPARLPEHRPPTNAGSRHLAVVDSELSIRLLQVADAIATTGPVADAEEWTRVALDRFPAAHVALAPVPARLGSFVAIARSGQRAIFSLAAPSPADSALLLASVAYQCELAERWQDAELLVRIGTSDVAVTIRTIATNV